MDAKTARKLVKCKGHVAAAKDVMIDLPDWVEHTDPSAWDPEVIAAHAKVLEAAGCHLRRLLTDLKTQGVVTDA